MNNLYGYSYFIFYITSIYKNYKEVYYGYENCIV
jgi:hypothetical protein